MADPLHPWYARLADGEPGCRRVVAVLSEEFPPGTVVDLPGARLPTGWQVAVITEAGRVRSVAVALPDAPLLWYVELAEPDATTLVAFSDPRHAEGAVLTRAEAQAGGISGGEQVAALRWWPGTGLVHQVYVQPAARRRGVAGKLAQVVGGIQVARGLPDLHGDGRRTDLGERWRDGLPGYVATRLAPWTHRVPAMDLREPITP